jgi:hypothetical protein
MSNMKYRMLILAVAIAAIAGILACGTGGLLSKTDPTATPTKTPKPTFTITPTPTDTPIPTDTPLPTNTATPTPLATNTPIVYTATATPEPTQTPVPTNTPRPTPRPTSRPKPTAAPTKKPAPTNTPQPRYAWRGAAAGSFPNCGYTGLMGLTLASNGGVAGDIWVHYWADGWNGDWVKSSWTVNQGYTGSGDEKNWDGFIDNYAKPGTWYACIVAQEGGWDCISDKMTAVTVHEPCEPGSGGVQVARFVFTKN